MYLEDFLFESMNFATREFAQRCRDSLQERLSVDVVEHVSMWETFHFSGCWIAARSEGFYFHWTDSSRQLLIGFFPATVIFQVCFVWLLWCIQTQLLSNRRHCGISWTIYFPVVIVLPAPFHQDSYFYRLPRSRARKWSTQFFLLVTRLPDYRIWRSSIYSLSCEMILRPGRFITAKVYIVRNTMNNIFII